MLETQTLLQWLFIDELLQVVQGFLHTIAFPLCPSYFEKKKKISCQDSLSRSVDPFGV